MQSVVSGTTHVIGLGVAGLSAAVRLAAKGQKVALYEGAGHAGGRCRSFFDTKLQTRIDNGNHLLLSGNKSALSYLDLLGARQELEIHDTAKFQFYDHKDQSRWSVEINDGLIPWWLLSAENAIPGVRLKDYLPALKMPFLSKSATMADVSKPGTVLYERFFEPMTWAVLNTTPERGSANLMWAVFKETFAKGGRACRPMIAKTGLSETFVDPALAYLQEKGATARFNTALKALQTDADRVVQLAFADQHINIATDDRVVLAVPRAQAERLLPHAPKMPDGDAAIVNAHFKMPTKVPEPFAPALLGLINTKTHWIFVRENIISLTISAADALGLDKMSEDELLPTLWQEVKAALNLPDHMQFERARLIRERRATFDQSPESIKNRPGVRTPFKNLYLAGDWTDTGLPATIEASIRSGETAANASIT